MSGEYDVTPTEGRSSHEWRLRDILKDGCWFQRRRRRRWGVRGRRGKLRMGPVQLPGAEQVLQGALFLLHAHGDDAVVGRRGRWGGSLWRRSRRRHPLFLQGWTNGKNEDVAHSVRDTYRDTFDEFAFLYRGCCSQTILTFSVTGALFLSLARASSLGSVFLTKCRTGLRKG